MGQPKEDATIYPLTAGLGFLLGQAHRALRAQWEFELSDLGVTSSQGAALRAVVEEPGLGPRQLARRMLTDPMNAKRLLDHLEQAAFVHTNVDPDDRRRRRAYATPRGEAIAREVAARAAAQSKAVADLVGPDGAAALEAALVAISAFGVGARARVPLAPD